MALLTGNHFPCKGSGLRVPQRKRLILQRILAFVFACQREAMSHIYDNRTTIGFERDEKPGAPNYPRWRDDFRHCGSLGSPTG